MPSRTLSLVAAQTAMIMLACSGGSQATAAKKTSSKPSGAHSTTAANAGSASKMTQGAGGASSMASAGSESMPSGGGHVRGCGQGTKCTPGDDLAPPDPADGFQIEFPNTVVVQPGQEQFLCYYKTVPIDMDVDVGAFQSWMSPGSSHHFILFEAGGTQSGIFGALGALGGGMQPDGTLTSCAIGSGQWMYATSLPGTVVELDMPDGVGLPMTKGTQLVLNLHVINAGSMPNSPELKLNVMYAKNVQYKAAAMVSFNATIAIPPGGMQTVQGRCNAPVGSKFFAITTHTHKRATAADVNFISGGQTMNIVHTTDWEHPDVGLWAAPDFLTVNNGDSFTYSCSYTNTESFTVTVGETAASNEMCMAIGYYFPAGNATCL